MPESLSLSVWSLGLLVSVVLAFAGGWLLREYLTRTPDTHVDDFLAEERRVQDMIKRLREEVAAPGAAEAPAAWSPPRDLPRDHSAARARLSAAEPLSAITSARPTPAVSAKPTRDPRDTDDQRFDDDGEIEVDVTNPPLVPGPILMRASLVLLLVGGVFGVVWLEGLRRRGNDEEWSLRAERALSSLPGAPEATFASDIPSTASPLDAGSPIPPSSPSAAEPPTAPLPAESLPSAPLPEGAAETPSTSPAPTPPLLRKNDAGPSTAAAATAASARREEGEAPAAPREAALESLSSAPEDAPSVTAAELCAPLVPLPNANKWRCDKPSNSAPGNYYYYTRIRTSRGTVVRHRWFRDDVLQQNIELRVGSSGPEGYRTYSRVPIGPDGRGTWRVELLDASNRVLHEARVVVQ